MITLESRPLPAENVVARIVNNEAVLVLPDQGQVKVLNAVGSSIWGLCDGQRTVQQIASEICKDYAVDISEAEVDTLAFLASLEARGIVAPDTTAGP